MQLDSIKGRVAPCPGIPEHVITDRGVIYRVIGTDYIEVNQNGASGHLEYKGMPVSHMVLTAFVGPKPEGRYEACHFPDADTFNNHYTNLCWGTRSDNARHMVIIRECRKDWRKWCCCESSPTLRCPVHPWVCVDPEGNGPTPAMDAKEEKKPPVRRGVKRDGVVKSPVSQETKDALIAYHLSSANPTYAETAAKFDVSPPYVGQIIRSLGLPPIRPGRRTKSPTVTIDEELKAAIVARYKELGTYYATAKEFGVSARTVQRYVEANDLIESNKELTPERWREIVVWHLQQQVQDINRTARQFSVHPLDVWKQVRDYQAKGKDNG